MLHAKNCEKLSKFVEVTAKILSVHFFRTRCTHMPSSCLHVQLLQRYRDSEILLTQRYRHKQLPKYSKRLTWWVYTTCFQNDFLICWHIHAHRLDENNILQLLLSPLVNGSLQSAYIITPSPVEKGAISVAFVRPSVSRTQRPSVFKFGTKVPRLRCDSHTSFKVKRSKVTRPINADTHRPP